MTDVNDILKKYGSKLDKNFALKDEKIENISHDYEQFKSEMMPNLSFYEKMAKSFGNINIKPSKKDEAKISRYLREAHLNLEAKNVVSLAFFGAFVVFVLGIIIFLGLYFYSGSGDIFGEEGFMGPYGVLLFLSAVFSIFVFYYLYSMPSRLASLWRLKASAQMVPCILYIVIYMKHTSNLERAIAFASQHLKEPLSLDLKKIFWDVETGKYSSIKESLDHYLDSWKEYSIEFVEAFHLIESSLYEVHEGRRIAILEKSLQVILDGVYEKMLVFSREVRSPLTNIYMLGVVLPTLALALLPLASTLLGGSIKVYHVFLLFNLIVPFFVFYLTNQIMLKRPGGYGESEILELNPDYPKYKSNKPYLIAALICIPLFLIGLSPFLFSSDWFTNSFGLARDYDLGNLGIGIFDGLMLFDFKEVGGVGSGDINGPFGLGGIIFSLFIPLSIGMFFSISYMMKTKDLMKARNMTKQLEGEFTNSLFLLGNRIGDGQPSEVAFASVAQSTVGQKTENFFKRVNLNLHQAGMSLEMALFDKNRGAIIYFPSELISMSMKILLESSKKGLKIAAASLMSISEYVKNIDKVNQRMRDLLAEVVSDMKSNMVFLAPLLSGIVVGLAAMIALILTKLNNIITQIGSEETLGGFGNVAQITELFNITQMIPPYFLQVSIGIYIVQIIFILTGVLVVIDSADDKLKRRNEIAKNLRTGMALYLIITFIAVIILSVIAAVALGGLAVG